MSVLILTVDEVMRTLTNDGQYPFVEKDKTVDIVRFALNTGFTDVILDENSALRVMYQRPGESEVRAQTLTYHDTDGLRNYYDWNLLPSDLTEKGTLTVALCILRVEDGEVEEWHTTPCQVRVLASIHTDDSDEGDESITPTVAQRVAVLETMIQRVASGAPIVVASMSAMTDTEQIYVLSTDGMWYYYDGSAWAQGGKYGTMPTDTTLTQSGSPADAKVTGDKLNKKITMPSGGTEGQLLQYTGNGGTVWTSFGMPTDAQVESIFSDWLDDHPEATTTVQDGSLTESKFSDALKMSTINNHVTPEMFGAVGDGETDDTNAFSRAISIGLPVKLMGDKTYKITGLNFAQSADIDGCGAKILATGIQYSNQGLVTFVAVTPNTNLAIKNISLKVTSHTALMGYIEGLASLTITGCTFDGNSWEDGSPVTFDDAPDYSNSYSRGAASGFSIYHTNNILIENNSFTAAWLLGLYIDYCKYGVIRNNKFSWFGRGGLYLRHENEYFVIDNNTLEDVVRYFTVNDGGIDLYGPDNAHVRITNNNIKGFGSTVRIANGITLCGGYDLQVVGNTVIADNATYGQSLIMIEQRTDSGVVHPAEGVIIENNNLINDGALELYYHIRSMENFTVLDGAKNTDVSIINNKMIGSVSVADIEIRHAIDNLNISGNTFVSLMIEADDRTDYYHKNVHINNNFATRIRVRRAEGVVIDGNSVNTSGTLTNAAPIIIENSSDVTLNSNRVLTAVASWLLNNYNTTLNIGEDNIVTDADKTYVTKPEKNLVMDYEGISVSASGYLAGKYVPLVSVYGNDSTQEATPSLTENYDYVPMNADGNLTVTVVTNGVSTILHDSTPKHAMPMSLESYANCEDSDGHYWKGDYRDWANGVDVHVMRCYTLTGTERYYEASEGVYVLEDALKPYAGVGLSTHTSEHFVFTTNFDDNTVYIYDRPMYFSNDLGESLVLRIGWFGEDYSTITDVMALFAEKYQNGTPFKIWYELKTPYTTPIPENELAPYNEIVIGNTTGITNSDDCYIKAQFFKNDEYGSLITSYAYSKPYLDAELSGKESGGTFRLIKTISISASTNNIYVNTDNDGNAFSLHEMIVYIDNMVASGSGNGCISVNSGQSIIGASVPYIACENLYSTSAKTSVAHLKVTGGRFFADSTMQGLANDFTVTYTRTSKNATGIISCDNITEFCLASINSHSISSGTITVYGR